MIPSIYRPDIKIIDLIKEDTFTFSAEVIPPRNGSSQDTIIEQIESLVLSGSQFLSVTKGAGGSLRGGSLPIAQVIKDHFRVPCIAHFTCRDLTPEEVENQLMDHHYFGIRNILALRGDPPQGVVNWQPKESSYPYAYQLIEQIKKLNSGEFLQRKGFEVQPHTKTDFCIGAAVYPDEPSEEQRLGYFRLKIEAGAEYGITQMLFSAQSYAEFLEECARNHLHAPILPGTRILKSKKQAERMTKRFAVKISDHYYNSLPDDEKTASPAQILDSFLSLIEEFKQVGAPGLHLFVLTDTELSSKALRILTKKN